MAEMTPDISFDFALEVLQDQAQARWGSDYVNEHQEALEQAASQIVSIANALPETETEPGFYQ